MVTSRQDSIQLSVWPPEKSESDLALLAHHHDVGVGNITLAY